MHYGPAVCRDVESEEMVLLASFRVRTVFLDDVRQEVDGLPEDPGEMISAFAQEVVCPDVPGP